MGKQTTVEAYIADLDGWQAQVAAELDRIVMEVAPQAGKVIKWVQPTYEDHGLLCYFKAFKTHVNFGFFRGAELDDPDGLLEGTGEKMRHVKLKSLEDVNEEALKRLVYAAAELNRTDDRTPMA
jgi:hypothetical protein